MVAIPRVRTFCGCCDLRTACVIIAALNIAGSIITISVFFIGLLFLNEAVNETFAEERQNDELNSDDEGLVVFAKILLYFWFFVVFILCFVTILFAYWFIRGIHSVRHCI